jgi:hypothetical protein
VRTSGFDGIDRGPNREFGRGVEFEASSTGKVMHGGFLAIAGKT